MRLALIRWRRGASSWLIWLIGLVSLAAWSGVVCAQFSAPSAAATRTTALLYQIDPTGRLSLPELLARPATHWQAMPPNGSLGRLRDAVAARAPRPCGWQ